MREGDFRIRGKEISRVEGLSDAVFGFAITLLALSVREHLQLDDLEVFDTTESLRATTKTSVLGGSMGLCYLIGTIRPASADIVAGIATALVFVVGLWIATQRRGRSKPRTAVRSRMTAVPA